MSGRIRFLFVFTVSLFAAASPTFGANFGENNHRKIYFPKENVVLHNNQILVGSSTKWLPIAHLSADEAGFYVTEQSEDYSLFQWECSRCGHDNWFWETYCWFCGRENK